MRSTTKRTIRNLIVGLAVLAGAGGTALAAGPPTGDVTDCHNWCATDPLKAIATRGACRVACNEVNHAGERGATFDFSRVGEILTKRYLAAVWEACERTEIALSAKMCKKFVAAAFAFSLTSERDDIIDHEKIEDFLKVSNLNDDEAKVSNLNDDEAKVFNINDAEGVEQIRKAIRDIVNIRVDS